MLLIWGSYLQKCKIQALNHYFQLPIFIWKSQVFIALIIFCLLPFSFKVEILFLQSQFLEIYSHLQAAEQQVGICDCHNTNDIKQRRPKRFGVWSASEMSSVLPAAYVGDDD